MATHKRTRTGCWTCREAGYKCDEQRPFCGRCTRLYITCKGYGVKLKWKDSTVTTSGKSPRQARRKKAIKEESSASPTALFDALSPSQSSLGSVDSSSDIKLPPAAVHSLSHISASRPLSMNSELSTEDQFLLHYWTEQLSSIISMVPRSTNITPFQVHLTSMAYASRALRSTLLSMAANHLGQATNDSSRIMQSFRYQRKAILGLQEVLNDPEMFDFEPALATILMMQISMRLFGDDDEGQVANHLMGAKAMIVRHGLTGSRSVKTSVQFLLSLFAYHDILSSVSRGSSPLAEHDSSFSAIEGDIAMQDIANVLLIVARISQLQDAIKDRRKATGQWLLTEYEDATAQQLQQALLTMDFNRRHATIMNHENSEISLTAEAYCNAAFIYLYRTWLNIGAPNPLSVQHVQQCLSNIEKIPPASPITSSHVWPLFTAGCESPDDIQRQFVRARFEEMYNCKRFPNLKRVMQDIEDVWAAKDLEKAVDGPDGMAGVDCIQVILRTRGREVDLS